MKKLVGILTVLLALLALLPGMALADNDDTDIPQVRVLLKSSSSADSFTFTVEEGTYDIVTQDGEEYIDTVEEGESYTLYRGNDMMAVPVDEDTDRFDFNGSSYRGAFKVMSNGSYLYAINRVNLEHYLYGVVGRELGYSYHIESTKAQAVAARSYAFSNISASNKYYDVTATVSSQVYGGYDAETARIREAVDDTYGMVLVYDDKIVQAYFASSAGGHTEDIEKVWLSDEIPIKGVPSPYDSRSGNYGSYGASCWSWTVEYTPDELVAMTNRYGNTNIGEFVGITMSTTYKNQTSVSGRAMIVTIEGTKDSVSATKDNIRSLLNLKSTLITITDHTQNNAAMVYVKGKSGKNTAWESLSDLVLKSANSILTLGRSIDTITVRSADGLSTIGKNQVITDSVTIQGYGYGHGIGMSQWGAIAMGDDGYTWEEIIEHYYCHNGIELVQYYE